MFTLRVVLAFLVGGTYVAGTIWISNRFGDRLGGIVAGLPSAILVSTIFVALGDGPAAARATVAVVPPMFSVTLVYGVTYLALISRLARAGRGALPVIAASAVWLAIAIPVVQLTKITSYWLVVLVSAMGLAAFWLGLRALAVSPANPQQPRDPPRYGLRFAVGGALVAGVVVAAHLLGPAWGGLVGSFPVMLGAVLFFLGQSRGPAAVRGFLRSLPLGYAASMTFMVAAHQTLTWLPWGWALGLSLVAALLVAIAAAPKPRRPAHA